MNFTAFTQSEASEAVETVSTAMDDPVVFAALLATPGLVPKVAGAIAILEDYVSNARPLTVARGVSGRYRVTRGPFATTEQHAMPKALALAAGRKP